MDTQSVRKKSLRDYTDDELYEILQKNETCDLSILSGICSEVLRRMITEEKKGKTISHI
jgi:hypothetical protein